MNDVRGKSFSGRSCLLFHVTVFWGGYLAILWVTSHLKGMLPQQSGPLVWGLTSSCAILAFTLLFLRIESRNLHDIGMDLHRASFLRLAIGLAVGLVFFGLQVLAVIAIAGSIQLVPTQGGAPFTVATAVSGILALSCMEELGFRGYALRTLVPGFGLWPAQAIVAVAFGLCHLAFGWSWTTILLGVIPSGLVFGMAAISSRGLAMPIGLHAGVNLAQSSLSEKSGCQFWTLSMDDQVRDRIATVVPMSGVGVAVVMILVFSWWHQFSNKRKESPDA